VTSVYRGMIYQKFVINWSIHSAKTTVIWLSNRSINAWGSIWRLWL